MHDTDFYLDGVSAKSKGIFSGAPISFSAAARKTKPVQIPGRSSGDLMLDEGGFYNREGSTTAYVLPKALGQNITAVEAMSTAAGFLFAEYRGYRRLITAEDSGHYWLAQVKNAAEIAPRLNLLNPFSITFDVQPYAYLTGYDEKTVVASGDVVNNPTLYSAYPILYITGTAGGEIAFPNGGIEIVDDISTEIAIDCEAGRAYDPITGANRNYLISATEFPFFNAGNNAITMTDAVVKYIPRFREIL